jgi:hypothetical protein
MPRLLHRIGGRRAKAASLPEPAKFSMLGWIRRPTSGAGLNALKAHLDQIKRIDKHIDRDETTEGTEW